VLANEEIKKIVIQEVKDGYSHEDEGDDGSVRVNREYLKALESEVERQLIFNYFHFPTQGQFERKIKELFGLEPLSKSLLLYANGMGESNPSEVWLEEEYLLISSKKFVTPLYRLPEILNYRKNCPNFEELERELDEESLSWSEMMGDEEEYQKTLRDNVNFMVRFNQYIFMEDNRYRGWLFEQNSLMESLVTSYGYNRDSRLIEKIIEERAEGGEVYLDDIVWHKRAKKLVRLEDEPLYNGLFRINQKSFEVIKRKIGAKKFHVPTQNIYLKALHRLTQELEEEEWLTQEEREQLVCHITSFLSNYLLNIESVESLELC